MEEILFSTITKDYSLFLQVEIIKRMFPSLSHSLHLPLSLVARNKAYTNLVVTWNATKLISYLRLDQSSQKSPAI